MIVKALQIPLINHLVASEIPSGGFLRPLGPTWESLRMALTNYCGS